MDLRTRMILAAAAVVALVATGNLAFSIAALTICMGIVIALKLPVTRYVAGFKVPILIVLFMVVPGMLVRQSWTIPEQAISTSLKITAAYAVVQLLVITSSIYEVFDALRWFRVPGLLVDIAWLMLHYTTVVNGEFRRVYQAQSARLGMARNVPLMERLRSISTILGIIILRSYTRSERMYYSMLSRGYDPDRPQKRSYPGFPAVEKAVIAGALLISAIIAVGWAS